MYYIISDAKISEDNLYRYFLIRKWLDNNKIMTYIMLNPSRADGLKDDPTIHKCVKLAMREECGSIYVVNLFASRSSKPAELYINNNPVGPENDFWINKIAKQSQIIVAAWGNHGNFLNRDIEVCERLKSLGLKLYCLGVNKNGSPKHPLARSINLNTKLIQYEY